MKLISEYYSEADAEAAGQRLRTRGILTHVSSTNSHRLSRRFTGAFKVGLWVVVDNQYQDACRILSGQQCKVRDPLDEEQMMALESFARQQSPTLILKGLLVALIVIGSAVATAVLFILHQAS